MSEADPKQIVALYDLMEKKLTELDITFDEFSVLYKTFKATVSAAGVETDPVKREEAKSSPFPWVKYAGYGKYS